MQEIQTEKENALPSEVDGKAQKDKAISLPSIQKDGSAVKPPYSNTGAQNTSRPNLNACVDWVSATFKTVNERELIEEILLLDPDKFDEVDNGLYGYQQSLRLGNIAVMYNGREDMGVHLQMSGAGCREYEHIGKLTWETLFRVILACEGQITRLDMALDDHVGYFTIRKAANKIKRGELASKFRRAMRIEHIEIADGKSAGQTIYFGSGQSMIRIRMYDKRLEQLNSKDVNTDEVPAFWNRTEIQSRKDRAQAVAGMIANDVPIGVIVQGILRYYLRFLVRHHDKNKSRWKTAGWWERFLDDVEPIRLAEKTEMEATIEKRLSWIRRQVAPSLAAVISAMDGEMTAIYDLIQDGMERLKPRDIAMIKQYKEHIDSVG